MRHPSLYLDWYIRTPDVKYDFRSSGIAFFKHSLNLNEVDLSINYAHGNPEAIKQLARWYGANPENVFISSEGASGQNSRLIRYMAEREPKQKEAIVEYPTYEPLLRVVQEHFPRVKRLERLEKDGYKLDADRLRKTTSEKTGLLVLTNPHAPTGAISNANELREVLDVARERGFHILCDEIYAEFDRKAVPSLFSLDPELATVTTSFTKAYGLGGLKLGVALTKKELVDELYTDVLNTVGNCPNIIQLIATELLTKAKRKLEEHKQKWNCLKKKTEEWLNEKSLKYFSNKLGVTYWVRLPIKDTYKWINEKTIPGYGLAPVPGAFFLFRSGYRLEKSHVTRIGLGNIDPEKPNLTEALDVFDSAINKELKHP